MILDIVFVGVGFLALNGDNFILGFSKFVYETVWEKVAGFCSYWVTNWLKIWAESSAFLFYFYFPHILFIPFSFFSWRGLGLWTANLSWVFGVLFYTVILFQLGINLSFYLLARVFYGMVFWSLFLRFS